MKIAQKKGKTMPSPAKNSFVASSQKIIDALQPFVDSRSLAGAVALTADKDRVLSLDSVGFADIAADRPMQPDALFWIASQTKPITATALMMLVDEGKLNLDDPVENYLPEFKEMWLAVEQDEEHQLLKRPQHLITVRNILSHTSGMPFSSALEKPTLDGLPLSVAVRSYAMTPLQSEPGARYQYSNAGTNTAGRLIEVLGGAPYEQFLEERLLKPLGMGDTTFWPDKQQLARLAKSYKPNAAGDGLEETTISQLQYPLDDRRRCPMPAGGLFSTATDLASFCQMILNDGSFQGVDYLDASSVGQMTSKQTGDAIEVGYGLGWGTDGTTFGHGGAQATNMAIDTKTGLITIFLVQHVGFPGDGGQSHDAFRKAAVEQFGNR